MLLVLFVLIARRKGVRVYADITRAVRVAPVIKLTVKIGGKRGNNGQIPVHIPGKRREKQQKSKSCIPDEWPPCIDRRGPIQGTRITCAGGAPTSDFWPCAQRKWTHCVSGFRGAIRENGRTHGVSYKGPNERCRSCSAPTHGSLSLYLVIETDSWRNHGLEIPSRGQPGRDRAIIVDRRQRIAQRSTGR